MERPTFTLWGFKKPKDIIASSLGKLERAVLETVWQLQEACVHDVQRALVRAETTEYAYTTLMTTLDRLYKKGLLTRHKEQQAFVYQPRFSREELERCVAKDVIDGMLAATKGKVEPVLAYIVETVSEKDRALLDDLELLIQEKKQELQRES